MPTTPPALIAVPDTLDFGNPPGPSAPAGRRGPKKAAHWAALSIAI